MFAKRLNGIFVVHNDEVILAAGRRPKAGRCLLRLTLDELLAGEGLAERIPKEVKGNHKSLCIVPDHWLGAERFAFQSGRRALIEPFLERKLGAAFPERKALRYFFNYRRLAAGEAGNGVMAYFLQDEMGYRLYDALNKLDIAPRHITSPAFLWLGKLAQTSAEFDHESTLLIHMGHRECSLYFYSDGHFIFSRSVVLSEGAERMEALTFEINQSQYMFSQKAKTELGRVYLLSESSADSPERFSETLGREVVDLDPLLEGSQTISIEDAPFLDGLLHPKDLSLRVPFFSLIHRRIKHELWWEPVQWAGILIGALLLLPLIGENLLLGTMIRKETAESKRIQSEVDRSDVLVEDVDQALDRVIEAAERPSCADTVLRLLAGLPAGIRIEALAVLLEDQPAVELDAKVRAESADQLKAILDQLVASVRANFKNADHFSLNDIDIGVDSGSDETSSSQYRISIRLELT